MNDPYKILGISPDASDEQVKSAYRELARKYHPDSYVDNPLSDLASEKMQEINQAYDEVQRQRRAGGGARAGGGSAASSSAFSDIRRLINQGRVSQAEELIDGVPESQRDGEWYFLKGSICYTRGWLDRAMENFTTACNLSPENQEYRAALNQMLWQQQNGYARGGSYAPRAMGCSCCDLCAAMYCTNCLCSCCGQGC